MKEKLIPEWHTLLLAPMADLTHAGFRRLIDEYGGCDLFYSEMIDARLYRQGGPLEKYYDSPEPGADRLIFQLIGRDREELSGAAEILARLHPTGIDVNMGCSAPHIIKYGAGCALMRSAGKARDIMKDLKEILPENMTLSAKIRLGEKESGEELLAFASALIEGGADFLVLHPKTRKEKGARPPRRDFIGLLQRELSVPVIANGHIGSYDSYRFCWDRQQPGGTMIGRQAARQPWFFALLKSSLVRDGLIPGPDPLPPGTEIDLSACWERFYTLLQEHQPVEFHKSRARRFSLYFSENLRFGHHLHSSLVVNARNGEEIDRCYREYFETHREEQYVRVD
ncbi:MAG: tRNA-dihydrouridine synthase family protein [Spirochaetales bacterium]|nr:tRNA-dihydrouridine synthase family protein [Spirochaetales bacterium]